MQVLEGRYDLSLLQCYEILHTAPIFIITYLLGKSLHANEVGTLTDDTCNSTFSKGSKHNFKVISFTITMIVKQYKNRNCFLLEIYMLGNM